MKSKEEILQQAHREEYPSFGNDKREVEILIDDNPYVLTAMQTYAEQESVEFAEWIDENCVQLQAGYYAYKDSTYTTSQLFKIYQNEAGRNSKS